MSDIKERALKTLMECQIENTNLQAENKALKQSRDELLGALRQISEAQTESHLALAFQTSTQIINRIIHKAETIKEKEV